MPGEGEGIDVRPPNPFGPQPGVIGFQPPAVPAVPQAPIGPSTNPQVSLQNLWSLLLNQQVPLRYSALLGAIPGLQQLAQGSPQALQGQAFQQLAGLGQQLQQGQAQASQQLGPYATGMLQGFLQQLQGQVGSQAQALLSGIPTAAQANLLGLPGGVGFLTQPGAPPTSTQRIPFDWQQFGQLLAQSRKAAQEVDWNRIGSGISGLFGGGGGLPSAPTSPFVGSNTGFLTNY